MKVICTLTNIEYTSSGFNAFAISSKHPMFSANFDTLLSVAEGWRADKLTASERRVLFVSLLDSTGLCEFKCAATPSDTTVQRFMEFLIVTATWKHAIGDRIPLSRIAINHDTRSLENIGNWLNNWNTTQREFALGSHMQAVRDKIAKSQEKLLKLLRDNRGDSTLYRKHLAKWFMVASNAPLPLYEYWTSLFTLQRPQIWEASLTDLEELKEHCEHNIPMNSTYAMHTYRLLCELVVDRREGVLGALSGSMETYTIVQEDTEVYNIQVAAEQASAEEPVERDYVTKGSYLVARARWKLKIATQAPLPTLSDDEDEDEDEGIEV